ncbi:hypothetical protein B7P34_23185 [Streptosporangium nondiastaticum]|uniref:ATP-grasp domain-containing protein n=1 Tax=Streptosporangium nondiastaticum TaxID=35764 RepID=A0A9X7JMA4_9ACTN|nr:ATP-grasp domain-containing protein [Streptosporangium nondiastaticum]PSJ26389.1 hypothetical protein B7P34_23185 [Streptosporangium nondiastaticum]
MTWICLLGPSTTGSRAVALHGHRLVVLAPPGQAVAPEVTAHAERVVFCDITDHDATRTVVDRLAAELGAPRLVVSFTEHAQEVSARIATGLGLPSVSPAAAAHARDKAAMRRLLADTPYAWPYAAGTADDIAGAVRAEPDGVAWIVKPADGAGSAGVTALDSHADLERWHSKVPAGQGPRTTQGTGGEQAGAVRYIAEHAATGPEFSVEAVSAAGRHTILAITAKQTTGSPNFVETGHVVPAPLPEADGERLEDAVRCVLDRLGIHHGASHTELRLDPVHGPVVIETHTRVGGDCIPELVELATGRDQYDHALAALLGTDPAKSSAPAAPAAAISFVTPPAPGALTGLSLDPTLTRGVFRWHFDRMPGADLTELHSSHDRVGYAIALAETPAEAMRTAAEATAGVRVHVTVPTP